MAKTGRPRKPTALKLLHGDQKSRIPTGEPVPADVPVEPPVAMDSDAVELWNRLAPDLYRQGVLTQWDAPAFGIFCQAMVYAQRAQVMVNQSGILLRARNRADQAHGVAVANPALRVFKQMSEVALQAGGRFGLTPADRARLATGERDPMAGEDLLSGNWPG